MYEVINEELGIKACGLADLTAVFMSHSGLLSDAPHDHQ